MRSLEYSKGKSLDDKTRKKRCPECDSNDLSLIHYGYINDPDAMQQIESGEIEADGCCVSDESPKWKCRDCGEQFGKINWS